MQKKIVVQACSREQKNKHVLKQFEALGVEYYISKMHVGDYQLPKNGLLIIEKKKDILELVGNIFSSDHKRFNKELVEAKRLSMKMIILIEEMHNYNTLCEWVSPVFGPYSKRAGEPMTSVKGSTLAKAMVTIQQKYGVSFKFCNKEETGKKILELLGVKL